MTPERLWVSPDTYATVVDQPLTVVWLDHANHPWALVPETVITLHEWDPSRVPHPLPSGASLRLNKCRPRGSRNSGWSCAKQPRHSSHGLPGSGIPRPNA